MNAQQARKTALEAQKHEQEKIMERIAGAASSGLMYTWIAQELPIEMIQELNGMGYTAVIGKNETRISW